MLSDNEWYICGLYKFSDVTIDNPSQNHAEITTEVNNVGRCIIINLIGNIQLIGNILHWDHSYCCALMSDCVLIRSELCRVYLINIFL